MNNLPWHALTVQSYTSFLQYSWHLSVVAPYSLQWGQSMKNNCERVSKTNEQPYKKTQMIFFEMNPWMTKCLMWLPTVTALLTFSVFFSKSLSGINTSFCMSFCSYSHTHTTKFTLKKNAILHIFVKIQVKFLLTDLDIFTFLNWQTLRWYFFFQSPCPSVDSIILDYDPCVTWQL